MAGSGVPLRTDPFLLRAELQVGRCPEEIGVAGQASILEAKRLDDQEAPQRDAEKIAKDLETERVKLDKARMVNKPKFRP